ncbi:T9SS type A sorting domain-containing protein [Gracilimonas tropica]|uniref:T9SS type A sorting domain-containing protein n=1 Tax=Gracilimonas tropica TaxID=454600 RepID=UPI000369ABDB|nr:T9SS type A sorting domain-containing protein [Gracilimonas tropica]
MKKVTTLFSTALMMVLIGTTSLFAQDVISIEAAKDSTDGTVVTVRGIAITPALESDSRTSFFIQDNGVGLNIFDFGTPAKDISAGDSVEVTGELDTYNGLREIVVSNIETDITVINSGNELPAPRVISYEEFVEAATPETDTAGIQGTLVRINDLLTTPADWPADTTSGSTNVDAFLNADSSEVPIRLLAQTEAIGVTPPARFDIVGVVGTFNGSQISPRFASDILGYYDITFQADMNDIIDSAAFVPGEDFITIPGSMNGWDTAADTLMDADDDGIYTKTLSLTEGDYSYKFHIYSNSGRITGGYEANQPTDNTNRNFTVTADDSLDAEMPSFDYRDLNDATFGEVELYFQVDMSIQELNGNFDPETEYVSVTGAFDGWSATSNAMTETQTESVYEVTVTFPTNQAIPSTYAYKFTIVNADESVSWESGDDKLITVTEDGLFEGKYLAQNAPDGNVPYFDNITPSDVFTEDTDVVFEVDLRPAYYTVADSGALPADVQTGTGADSTISWLYGNGPLLANGWEDWGVDSAAAKSAGLFFNDRGVDGDEVAGDSLFSATFSYVAGDARVGAFKMGVNGQDNEAGFGADHNVRINDANKIEVVFGGFIRADSVYDDLYDEYILATEEGPVVVRRGGSGDDGVVVSNETETIETPQEFTLSQNYPNPFNPTTNINFTLPQATNVTLTVYNVLGQQVARLVNGRLAAGQHSVQFDASNLASGMYLYRIEAGTFAQNKKMMLIK